VTWIRWETKTPRHELVGPLAEGLRIRKAEALGLYNAVCCNFGEYKHDGRADQVSDTTLEDWAMWEGKKGRFAAVFRERCVERQPEKRDAVGVIKGWWRQEALLREQERSRTRPGQGSRGAPERPRKGPGTLPERPRENPEMATKDLPVAFAVPSRGNVVSTTLPERVEISGGSKSSHHPAGFALEGASPAPTPQEERQHRDRQRAGFHQAAHESPS
jgi:hypothetical protein